VGDRRDHGLLAENSSLMSIVTFKGPDLQAVVLQKLKIRISVTATKGMAWIVVGKISYLLDPTMTDKDPGTFKMYSVPLSSH
jgi:hypothetical protein